MNTKRVYGVTAVFAVFAIVALSGCGNEDSTQSTAQVQETAQETTQADAAAPSDDAKGDKPAAPDGEGKGGGQMPEEATEACEDKVEGDTCETEMENPDGETTTMSGTCQAGMEDTETLVCMPEGGPQGGPGGKPADDASAEE